MKKTKFYIIIISIMGLLTFESCGPVVISSRPSHPPPPWFYPNRLEVVRYVYFPEYNFYFDLTLRNYLYLDRGTWIRVNTLPPRYNGIDLRRSRYERVRAYNGDNIKRYHDENNLNRGRSNRNTQRRIN
ncbi:hypothetical protein GGR42_000850 [Saonia flava]|uniref:Uncharacterized protein n=1 Tax=Saonia flava TaxID=523696 RepID=A0A846QQK0_9FLAO|nr:hypothetical protein [Saonia flava]NJB70388.1 hypothetical protein [Saonia flava]